MSTYLDDDGVVDARVRFSDKPEMLLLVPPELEAQLPDHLTPTHIANDILSRTRAFPEEIRAEKQREALLFWLMTINPHFSPEKRKAICHAVYKELHPELSIADSFNQEMQLLIQASIMYRNRQRYALSLAESLCLSQLHTQLYTAAYGLPGSSSHWEEMLCPERHISASVATTTYELRIGFENTRAWKAAFEAATTDCLAATGSSALPMLIHATDTLAIHCFERAVVNRIPTPRQQSWTNFLAFLGFQHAKYTKQETALLVKLQSLANIATADSSNPSNSEKFWNAMHEAFRFLNTPQRTERTANDIAHWIGSQLTLRQARSQASKQAYTVIHREEEIEVEQAAARAAAERTATETAQPVATSTLTAATKPGKPKKPTLLASLIALATSKRTTRTSHRDTNQKPSPDTTPDDASAGPTRRPRVGKAP